MTTEESNITNFNKDLMNYYKLKRQYEAKAEDELYKLRTNNNLTTREKQQKFLQFKLSRKCINCNKTGGTIFKQESNVLSAKCGNAENPCNLDIKLEKVKFVNINKLIEEIDQKININKTETIISKLKLLFGFTSEVATLQEFNKLKAELIIEVKKYQQINEQYLDIVLNIPKMRELTQNKNDLLINIQKFKDFIKNFEETGNVAILKEAMELYTSTIMEITEKIRNLKYIYNTVEYNEEDNTHHLIQKQYTQSELQIPIKTRN
jgi:hypothetical protein